MTVDTKYQLVCKSIEDLPGAAKSLLRENPDCRIFAFFGPMGVGKTTFIKALCEELGVKETVSSPSFSIVNQYLDEEGNSVYHFDFYRIKKIEEAFDIGYEDYFFSGEYCFIEWPDKVEGLIPVDAISVFLEEKSNNERIISF